MCAGAQTASVERQKLCYETAGYLSAFAGSQTLGDNKARRNQRYLFIEREIMKNTFTKKQLGLAAASAVALSVVSGAAFAQSVGPALDRELWRDTPQQIWKNGYGECWHSAYGPPPGYNECNPAPVAQYVAPPPPPPPPAPVYVAPPPPPPPAVIPAPLPPKKTRG